VVGTVVAPAPERPGTGWARLLTEPARPEVIRRRPDAHWLVVATVCIGAFMGQLDASIVTLAFPALRHEFGASIGAVEWVALAYLLTLVAVVPAVGRFADMAGRKLLYTYGFIVFSVASVACGFAPNLVTLDVLRVVQALGAAMLQANSVALITLAMPPGKLGRGIGIQGAAQAIGLALGPTVGGALIGLGGWRLIFFVNGPVGVIGTLAGWFLLPRTRHHAPRARFDWPGLALFAPAVAALLLGLSQAERLGMSSGLVIGLLAASAVGVALFVARERRIPAPMVDLALFRRPAFGAGISSGLLSYFVLFGVLFVTPFFLEAHDALSPARAGLVLTVLPVGLALVAPIAGRLADRFGARLPTASGMVLTAAALGVVAAGRDSLALIVAGLALAGVGLGLFTPANNAAIMGAAPPHQAGSAGGVLNMTRGVGTSLGVAVTALVFSGAGGAAAAAGAHHAASGFSAALLMLAGVSLVAAAVASTRGQVALSSAPEARVE
jgi:EmrB/QacA subfamily drug resistance transporter